MKKFPLDLFPSHAHQFHLAVLLMEPILLRVSGEGLQPSVFVRPQFSTWGNAAPSVHDRRVNERNQQKEEGVVRPEEGLAVSVRCRHSQVETKAVSECA